MGQVVSGEADSRRDLAAAACVASSTLRPDRRALRVVVDVCGVYVQTKPDQIIIDDFTHARRGINSWIPGCLVIDYSFVSVLSVLSWWGGHATRMFRSADSTMLVIVFSSLIHSALFVIVVAGDVLLCHDSEYRLCCRHRFDLSSSCWFLLRFLDAGVEKR
ncbi:hypothetical protein Y032_0098g3105 [Ancylostoma ceylanicum]|uniref:Uncharacterized protein n=1 Tax=Ancylostoma ceylanicum TaxID=53326 RepID=A0A016TJ73_9BILA|nr:hypothetical protein Y032_0098g3105 [Ancylostoma ceylanicum]